MIELVETGGGVPLYQLKITLKWSKPPIWRRVVVRADMKLHRLHEVIQHVMPWMNCHLHHFAVGRTYFGVPDPDSFLSEEQDEKRFTLAQIAPKAKSKFIYEYDFGDGWMHEIQVEKILPPDANFKHPVCVAGANACPPDDCGGIPGYYNMLAAVSDPKHPEHECMKEWIGDKWDPARFDLEEINDCLKRMKA